MNKHKRNKSCPCGSGRKYKKCCMAKDMEGKKVMDKPTNTFREEIQNESANPDVMMLRDQIIMARAMECNHTLAGIRRRMLESTLAEVLILQKFMQQQSISPGLPDLIEAARLQVEAAKKSLESPDVSRADAVQLEALRSAISLGSMEDQALDVIADREIEDATLNIKAPIEDDGLPTDDETDSTDDESEEEIEIVDPNEVPVKLEG